MTEEELRKFRDRLELPIPDDELKEPPYYHPGPDSGEIQYMLERRRALGGSIPRRTVSSVTVSLPEPDLYQEFYEGSGEGRSVSTTMAFVRLLRKLMKDERLGPSIIPIVPDEARTFGIESLFREFKIYASSGQRYEPADHAMVLSYSESKQGQILEEGITEAGSMASFTAAGTAYSGIGLPTIPFFIFYSMFGFQRVGDLIWAAADARARGFLLGATAGRTTLNGEGLQHQDGHSLLHASTVPSCISYDPAFAFEIALIIEEGMRRMWKVGEDLIYYLTVYNENYEMLPMPDGVREGVLQGLYRFRGPLEKKEPQVRLLGSGSILQQALRAQELLSKLGISSEVWSATSYTELRREALECERYNRIHFTERKRIPYVTRVLSDPVLPVVAVSDWMKALPDSVARWAPGEFLSLGTDGFGRSDTREALRRYFEIDAEHVAFTAMVSLLRAGKIKSEKVTAALSELGLEPEALDALLG
jgi:pyruvate dehydrogenase E1 component